MKIYYRFDKEAQTDCLAKIPQVHQIHTISMDERQTVGLVDLKVCVRAMVQCSPELVSQPDTDYTLYAYDYSEPETPLVGQGMLSWLWSSLNGASTSGQSEQFVTGKVTKNLLPGIKEFLEVRFKLTGMPRFNRPAGSTAMSTAFQPASLATNPSESSMSEVNEWNAFVQSNPAFGRSANMMVMASIPPPGAAQPGIVAPVPSRQQSLPQLDTRSDAAGQSSLQRPSSRPSSRPPLQRSQSLIQPNPQQMTPGTEDGRGLPTPIDSRGGRTSRPSSRASTRGPTGKPRGRPRKKPLEGTTSGVEDATDAEDPAGPPKKKRAMPTRVDEWDGKNAMGMADSLRVAASTSGSIRTFRPVGPASDPVGGSHLQEVPRVPTPVPGAHGGNAKPLARKVASNLRRESSAAHDFSHQFGRFRLSQSQDARSPAESVGQSPGNYHSPEDSPADIGSSPPVPGPAVYMNSSPASSPILPAMPHADSGFMSGGIEDLFEDEEFLSTCQVLEDLLPMTDAPVEGELGHVQDTLPTLPAAESHRQTAEATASQQSKPAPKRKSTAKTSTKAASPSPWVQEIPGPEELLPATSIYSVPINNTKRIAAENDGNIPIHQPNAKRRKTQDVPPRTSTVNNDMRGASPAQIPPVASMAEPTEQDQAKAPNNATADGPASTRAPGAHATDTTQHVSPKDGSSAGQTARNGHPTPTPAAQSPDDRSQADVNNAKPSLSRSTSSETKSADPPLVLPAPPPPTRQEQPPQSDPPRVEVPPTGRGKNYERKQNIKVRLQNAIARGEMPPFCYNCGAIETSTWRKIWAQDHYGPPPANIELSEKPGRITAVEIIAQDSEGNPTQHRLLKKSLLPEENKAEWSEQNLCNRKFCGEKNYVRA